LSVFLIKFVPPKIKAIDDIKSKIIFLILDPSLNLYLV